MDAADLFAATITVVNCLICIAALFVWWRRRRKPAWSVAGDSGWNVLPSHLAVLAESEWALPPMWGLVRWHDGGGFEIEQRFAIEPTAQEPQP